MSTTSLSDSSVRKKEGLQYEKGMAPEGPELLLVKSVTRELRSHDEHSSRGLENCEVKEIPYTLLTYNQKWIMVLLLVSAGFWSSLGSPIYYPALKKLEKDFDVSEELINVTVVVYLLLQGIAPTISGGIADVYGRRPIILFGMLVYVVGSIALACAHSYGVVVFLRCLQSAGISPIIAVNSGCVGDFTVRAERGTFVGAVSGLTLLGQAFGSLIGAALTASFSWRAIFWFLAIGCGSAMVILCFTLIETKRTIVGNLSIRPKRLINFAPVLYLKRFRRQFKLDDPDYESLNTDKVKFDVSSAIKIIALPEITLSLLPAAFQFVLWTLSLASLPAILSEAPYNYTLTVVGLCYLPSGIGGLLGSLVTGKVIDVYYKRSYEAFQQKRETGQGNVSGHFNIFKARLISGMPQNFTAVVAFTLLGWSLKFKWNVAVVMVTSFFGSFCAMSTLATSTTLLVDLYPGKSSTATSCFNFIRCILGAAFMAAFTKLKQSMNIGGTFTFVSGLVLLSNLLLAIPMKYGMAWRDRRKNKL